jgi:hypothetical protein
MKDPVSKSFYKASPTGVIPQLLEAKNESAAVEEAMNNGATRMFSYEILSGDFKGIPLVSQPCNEKDYLLGVDTVHTRDEAMEITRAQLAEMEKTADEHTADQATAMRITRNVLRDLAIRNADEGFITPAKGIIEHRGYLEVQSKTVYSTARQKIWPREKDSSSVQEPASGEIKLSAGIQGRVHNGRP